MHERPEIDFSWLTAIESTGKDVLVYCGAITTKASASLVALARGRTTGRQSLLLVLGTNGGDPDAAYRMMRCLQECYPKGISLMVPLYCKSAGTLMAVGADEIIMPDDVELGPLDMQVGKHDEFGDITTSLMPQIAINVLTETVFQAFEKKFASLRHDTGYRLTSKTCANIAVRLTIGCFGPIFSQLDPMRLAEMTREIQVARHYGNRLKKGNLKPEALELLISAFPSHEFVIDRKEANTFFKRVRKPTADEQTLTRLVVAELCQKMNADEPTIQFLDTPTPNANKDAGNADDQAVNPATAEPTGSTPGDPGRTGAASEHREPKPIGRGKASPTKRGTGSSTQLHAPIFRLPEVQNGSR